MINVHPLVQEYVEDVCKQVKAKELREEIKDEITSHLDELIESKRSQGLDHDAAAQWAITQMGDTFTVAKGLNQVHKPRVPWGVLTLLGMLLTIALLAMYAVDLNYIATGSVTGSTDLFLQQALYIVIGLFVMLMLSRINYRPILRFYWIFYAATILFLLSSIIWGPYVNGMSSYINLGSISINVMEASLYLFIVAAAGFLYRRKETWMAVFYHTILFSAVPLIVYALAPSFSSAVIYAISYTIFLLISRCSWKWIVPHALLYTVIPTLYVLFSHSALIRLTAFLNRHTFSDAGYMYTQINEAIRSAGWWGNGFASVTQRLPFIHADTVFTYLVYSLGWLFGVFVLLISLLFVSQLVKAALAVQDTYGKMIISGLGVLLAVQFAWSIGMSLGVLPIFSMTVPFIGYGGSGLLIQFAAIGIIYCVYRRKDMIRIS